MKKFSLFLFAAMCMLGVTMLTACGDDNDEPKTKNVKSIDITAYSIFSGEMLKVVDVTMVVFDNDVEKRVPLNSDGYGEYKMKIDKFPADVTFWLEYKMNGKTVDTAKKYPHTRTTGFDFVYNYTDGSKSSSQKSASTFISDGVTGDKLSAWVTSQNSKKIAHTISFDKEGKIVKE